MPPTPKDLLDFLSIYKENSVCYLERVNGMTGQSASASFVFGEGYGQLTMGLIACGIPTVTVSPQTWQKTIGLRNTDKLGKTEWKNILKKKAQQLFPYAKVTLATSDALLICEYEKNKKFVIAGIEEFAQIPIHSKITYEFDQIDSKTTEFERTIEVTLDEKFIQSATKGEVEALYRFIGSQWEMANHLKRYIETQALQK